MKKCIMKDDQRFKTGQKLNICPNFLPFHRPKVIASKFTNWTPRDLLETISGETTVLNTCFFNIAVNGEGVGVEGVGRIFLD